MGKLELSEKERGRLRIVREIAVGRMTIRKGAGSRNRMLLVFAHWLSEASRWVKRRMQKSPLGREDRGGFLLELCDGGCWAGGWCPAGVYRREVPRFRQTWAAEGAATPSDGPPATPRPNASLSIDWYSS